jgi:hypothetical protein
MDKLCSNISYRQSDSGIKFKKAKETDIDEFEISLDKLVNNADDNHNPSNSVLVEYLNPIGMTQTKIIYKNHNDDEMFIISTIPLDLIDCYEHVTIDSSDNKYVGASKAIDSIEELSRVFDSLRTMVKYQIQNNWKFSYIDSSLDDFNIIVKKEGHNNISVMMSIIDQNIVEMKILAQKLHDQLLQKGWRSEISLTTNNDRETSMWQKSKHRQ